MFKKIKKVKNLGMTFLELVVVLGIFGAIAATVLFNYSDFSSNVDLQNLSQDIALQIKKTQTDAVSGRIPSLSDSQSQNITINWTPSYGIVFTTDDFNQWASAGRAFIYYFNSYSDGQYDNGEWVTFKDFYDFETSNYSPPCGSASDSECLEEITITSGEFIDVICFEFVDISQDDDCTQDGDSSDRAYISFTRPRSNATILGNPNEPLDAQGNVFIRLTSVKGGHKYIVIWESGYVSIK